MTEKRTEKRRAANPPRASRRAQATGTPTTLTPSGRRPRIEAGDNAFAAAREAQRVPVRLYESDGRVMVAAPLPGLEPQDISVTVSGSRVTIHGHLRGPRQDEHYLLASEWQVGPYHRELSLPHPVDAARTNATFGNGVLVLVCPKAPPDEPPPGALSLELTATGPTRGMHVGHTGHDMHQMSTDEHLTQIKETSRRAANSVPHAPAPKKRATDTGPVNV